MNIPSHIVLSTLVATGSYAVTEEPLIAVATLLTGVLIDGDHLLNCLDGIKTSPKQYKMEKTLYVPLHSVEVWFVSFVVSLFIPFLLWPFISYTLHLIADHLTYKPKIAFHSLIHRLKCGTQDTQGDDYGNNYSVLISLMLLVYGLLHIFVFTAYTPPKPLTELGKWLSFLQWFVPTGLLIFLVPGVHQTVANIAKRLHFSFVHFLLCFAALCAVAEVAKLPMLWGSFSTFGFLALVIAIVTYYTKVPLLGIMTAFLSMGVWDVIYNTGVLLYHDFFGHTVADYRIMVIEQFTWIVPPLITMVVYCKRRGNIFKANVLQLPLFFGAVACTVAWFVTGFEIPLRWVDNVAYVNTEANSILISLSRTAQFSLFVGLALIFKEDIGK